MSVNLENRRNVGFLLALVVATVLVAAVGILWLRGRGEPLIVEVAYGLLVLLGAAVAYDNYLIQ
ncbi:hypothetical protein [Halopelagius longus]|uniref:Uncharacterized protein n=1 Tax=Halopelagius longus TaxID=1236180 RepID=A0A1H1FMQ2_9EURY|nr:hypothetical protein [Halopelagius longus]RDI70033.1 hypothetical protein DWB78_15490 [Halopelagius longus]SDR02009.1 hypothetical protein SAMN05216278_3290 [Halopelagius longus]